MNDKVWDLIEQADEEGGDDPDIRDALLVELVVRECLEVIEKQFGGAGPDGVEWDRAIDFTYEDVKKHFGVEVEKQPATKEPRDLMKGLWKV